MSIMIIIIDEILCHRVMKNVSKYAHDNSVFGLVVMRRSGTHNSWLNVQLIILFYTVRCEERTWSLNKLSHSNDPKWCIELLTSGLGGWPSALVCLATHRDYQPAWRSKRARTRRNFLWDYFLGPTRLVSNTVALETVCVALQDRI